VLQAGEDHVRLEEHVLEADALGGQLGEHGALSTFPHSLISSPDWPHLAFRSQR